MITLGEQGGMILPVGQGMGPTQVGQLTMSPNLAAGNLPVKTEEDPFTIIPGPPGTQPGMMQGKVWLVTTAAGRLLISTVGTVASTIWIGIGGCGIGVGTGAGGWIGA